MFGLKTSFEFRVLGFGLHKPETQNPKLKTQNFLVNKDHPFAG